MIGSALLSELGGTNVFGSWQEWTIIYKLMVSRVPLKGVIKYNKIQLDYYV